MCIHTNPCNEPFNCISNKSFNFSSDNFMLLGASGCQQGGLSLILSWILLSFVQKYQIALSYYGFSSRLKIYILVMLLLFVWIVWITIVFFKLSIFFLPTKQPIDSFMRPKECSVGTFPTTQNKDLTSYLLTGVQPWWLPEGGGRTILEPWAVQSRQQQL